MNTKMKYTNSIIINTTGIKYDKKAIKILHTRIKTNEDYLKFVDIMKNDFNIEINSISDKNDGKYPLSNIRPKLDIPNHKREIFYGDMPDYSFDKDPWAKFDIYCITIEDRNLLSQKVNTELLETTKSLWYPNRPALGQKNEYWDHKDGKIIESKYPLYIISKGRWEKRLTQQAIEGMKCKYKIVVEEDEVAKYIEYGVPKDNILMFSNEDKKKFTTGIYKDDGGSIPVRNFIWKHSIAEGHKKHWCIDDNINGFYRFTQNKRTIMRTAICFRAVEKFTDRYENLYMSGMNYNSFMPEISKNRTNIQQNSRIYSMILLDNKMNEKMNEEWQGDYLWRGKYNEDTDLSLRLLKSGYPTALSNAFLGDKMTTMSCKGGNTSGIYQANGLQLKLDSLIAQHPDVCKGTIKFKKVHHQVNYKPYEDIKFIMKEDYKYLLEEKKGINEMKLKIFTDPDINIRKDKQKIFNGKLIEKKIIICKNEEKEGEKIEEVKEEEEIKEEEIEEIKEEVKEEEIEEIKEDNKTLLLINQLYNHINIKNNNISNKDKVLLYIKDLSLSNDDKKEIIKELMNSL